MLIESATIQWLVVVAFLVLVGTSLASLALARYRLQQEHGACVGNVVSLEDARRRRA